MFSFAAPLLAGPGAKTSHMLGAGTKGDYELPGAPATILAVTAVTLPDAVSARIGVTAPKVIVRVFGVLLAALAVQSIFNGLSDAPIFG